MEHPFSPPARWGFLDFIRAASSSSSSSASSTVSSKSQWGMPDLNRELQISVGIAGPQPRAPDVSAHCHLNGINVRIDALRCHGGDDSKQSHLEKSLGLLKAAKVFLHSCGYTVVFLSFTALETSRVDFRQLESRTSTLSWSHPTVSFLSVRVRTASYVDPMNISLKPIIWTTICDKIQAG